MKTEADPLVKLLGSVDQLLKPIRDWLNNPWAVGISERQDEYPKRGIPLQHGGGTEAERKRS